MPAGIRIFQGGREVSATNPLYVAGTGGGGGGGGGDANAANQVVTNASIGAVNDAAAGSDTATASLNSLIKRLLQRTTTHIGQFPATLGQKNKAGSFAVTLASDENILSQVGATNETAPVSDTATVGLNGRLQRVAQNLTALTALFPQALGQANKAASLPVTLASDEDLLPRLGANNEAAPGSDTASAGLNGRLQRVAQNLTSLAAKLPGSLGTKTAATSLPVTLASDEAILTSIAATNTALDNLLTESQAKANLNETQPVTLAGTTVPLPTGAALDATVVATNNVLGSSAATAWGGTGTASVNSVLKGMFNQLATFLSVKLFDSSGVAYSNSNPVPVQIGQLLASQDSVQANQYALGASGAYANVRVPTAQFANVAGSIAANGQVTLLAAQGSGLKGYVFQIRVSAQVVGATPTNTRMSILDGTGGTPIERFRIEAGRPTVLTYPNGCFSSSTNTLLSLQNNDDETLTNVEWSVSYAPGA